MPQPAGKSRNYELPEYARDFKNLPAEDQERYYAKFGLKTAIERRLFNFLCQVIADAQKKTRRPATSYKYYSDIVLKWASNPNNLRSIQGFPRSEQTLKNNLDPLLERLIDRGVCRVIPGLEEPDEHKFIALQPEEMFGAPAAEKELEALIKFLNREYDSAADDQRRPLPSRQQIESNLKRPVNPALNVATLPPEQFNRERLQDPEFREASLIEIPLGDNYTIMATPAQLEQLPDIMAARMVGAIRSLPSMAPLDNLLKEKFPSETTLSSKQLLEAAAGDPMSAFQARTTVWTTIAYFLMEEIKRTVKDGTDRQNKRLAAYFCLTWLSHERTREVEAGMEEEVIRDIYSHIASHPRYMTVSELKTRPKVLAYLKKHDEEGFNLLFSRFIREYSLETNPDNAVIRLTGKVIGTCYIHSQHILAVMRAVPVKEKSRIDQIAHRFFVLPISENLYRTDISDDVREWMEDDLKIEEKFREILVSHFPELTDIHSFLDIHDFFSDNPETVSFLCTRYHFPEHAFLINGPGGSKLLRPLLAMLEIPGAELVRRAHKHVPLLRKYLYALKNLFGGGGDKSKARKPGKKRPAPPSSGKQAPDSPGKSAGKTHIRKKGKSGGGTGGGKYPAAGKIVGKKKPPGAKTVSVQELFERTAKNKSADYYLGIWNRVLGPAAEENLRICHAIIQKKAAGIERRVKGGETFVDVAEQASYIAYAPQLGKIEKKDALARYVQLKLLEALETLRKTKNLRFEYITVPK